MPAHPRASHNHAPSQSPSITEIHQETYRMALVTNKFRHDLAKVNLPIIASYADNYQARQAGQEPQTGYGDYDAFTILTTSKNSVDRHIYSSPRRQHPNTQQPPNDPTKEPLTSLSNLSSSVTTTNTAVNSSSPSLHVSTAPHAPSGSCCDPLLHSSQRIPMLRPAITSTTTQRLHTSATPRSISTSRHPLRATQRTSLPTRQLRLLDSFPRQNTPRVADCVTSAATTHHNNPHITETDASAATVTATGTGADAGQRLSEERSGYTAAPPHCCPASCPPDALGKLLNSFSGFADPEDGDNIPGKHILTENSSFSATGAGLRDGGVESTVGKGLIKSTGTGACGATSGCHNAFSTYLDTVHTLTGGPYTQMQLLLAAFAAQCSVARPPLHLTLPSDITLGGDQTPDSDNTPGNEGTLGSVAAVPSVSTDVAVDFDWATHGRCAGCDLCAAAATEEDAVYGDTSGRTGRKAAGGVQSSRRRGGGVGSGSGARTASSGGSSGGSAPGGNVEPLRRALVVSAASLLHNPWLNRMSNGRGVGTGTGMYGSMGMGTNFVEASGVDRGVVGMDAGANASMGVPVLHSKNDDRNERSHYGNVNRTTNVTITRTHTFTESRNFQPQRINSGSFSEDVPKSTSSFSDAKSKTLPQTRLPRVAAVAAERGDTQRLPTVRRPATQQASSHRPTIERLPSQRPIVQRLGTIPRPPEATQTMASDCGTAFTISRDAAVNAISTPIKPDSTTAPGVSACSPVPTTTMSLLVDAHAHAHAHSHPYPIQLPSSPSPSPSASPSPSPAVHAHTTPTGHVFTPMGMGFTPSGMGVPSPLWSGATAVSPHAVSDTSSSDLHRALDASVFFASKSPMAFIKKKFDFGFSRNPESRNPRPVGSEEELSAREEGIPHIHVVGATPTAGVPVSTGMGASTSLHLSTGAFAPTRRAASAASITGRSAFVPAASHATAASAACTAPVASSAATAAPSVPSATSVAPPCGAHPVSASDRPALSASPLAHTPATPTIPTNTLISTSTATPSASLAVPSVKACPLDAAPASACGAAGADVRPIPGNIKVTLSRDSSVIPLGCSPDSPSSLPPSSSPPSPMAAVTPLACLSRSSSTDTQQLPSLPAPSLSPASTPASPTLSIAKDQENIFPEEQFLDSENTFSEPGISSFGFSGTLSLIVPSHIALPPIHPSPPAHATHINDTNVGTNTTNTSMPSLPFSSSPRAAVAPTTPSSAPSASSVSAILRSILFALPLAPLPYALLPDSARRGDEHDGPTSTHTSSSSTSLPPPHSSSTSPSRPPTRSTDPSLPTHGLASASFRRTRLLAHGTPTHPLVAATNTLLTHLAPRPRAPPRIRARTLPAQPSSPASRARIHASAPSADAVRRYASALRAADALGGVDLHALVVLAAQMHRDARAKSSYRSQRTAHQHQYHQPRKHQSPHMQYLRSPRAAATPRPLAAAYSAVSVMGSTNTPAVAPTAGTRVAIHPSAVTAAPTATDATHGGHTAGPVSVAGVDRCVGEDDNVMNATADASNATKASTTTAAGPVCPRSSNGLGGAHAGMLAVVVGPSSPRSCAQRRASEVAFIRPHPPSIVPARAASSLSHHYPSSALSPSSHLPQSLLAPPVPLATTHSSVSVPVLLSGDQHYPAPTRESHYTAASSIQRPRSSATNASRRPRTPAIAASSSFFCSSPPSQPHAASASTPSAPSAAAALAWPLLRCAERELLRDPVLMQMDQHMDALYKSQAILRARTASLLARHEAEDAAIVRLQGYYPFTFPDESADTM